MTHASLFSGIGGFDLAAEWAGWTNLFNCEIDPFCQRVLKYHFPDAEQYTDIRNTDFTLWRGRIDVLTGGFPCQPFSLAGKRKGTEDERHLWPEMLRAVQSIRPRWIVGENVFGIVNWSEGLVFEQVCSDLEREGYEVQPYIIPAAGVGAPHKRDRVWFVAKNTECIQCDSSQSESKSEAGRFGVFSSGDNERVCGGETRPTSDSADTRTEDVQQKRENRVLPSRITPDIPCQQSKRLQSEQREISKSEQGESRGKDRTGGRKIPNWNNFPTQSPVCCGDDVVPGGLDGITFSKWRQESIKAYGNAIVPQVVYQIFLTINEYENR